MLITLPSDAVSGEITGTGLDFRAPLAKIFQSPQIQEQNTLKSTFHSLLHSHYVYNTINFSFLLETKSSSFLVLNG